MFQTIKSKTTKNGLIRFLIVFSICYLVLQAILCYNNDKTLSRFFWLEHHKVKELIDTNKPEKSELTPVVNIISDHHFWLLRTAVIICIALAFYYKNRDKNLYNLLLNLTISVIILLTLSSGLLTWLLKLSVGKPRPYTRLEVYSHFSLSNRYHSFPSGHTTETFSYLLPFMYFIRKPFLIIFLSIYGILTVFTRVLLAKHYLTDVLSGIYITVLTGCIICYLMEHRKEKQADQNK